MDGIENRARYLNYVAGFCFSECGERVALIRKLNPEWPRGLLNGIGCKVEPGEKPYATMVREFEEETGARVEGWRLFRTATTEEDRLHFFTVRGDLDALYSAESEEVLTVAVDDIPTLDTIPNLRWLVPLALDEGNLGARLDYPPLTDWIRRSASKYLSTIHLMPRSRITPSPESLTVLVNRSIERRFQIYTGTVRQTY